MFTELNWFTCVSGIRQACLCEIVCIMAVVVSAETLRYHAILTECVDNEVHDAFASVTPHLCSDISP